MELDFRAMSSAKKYVIGTLILIGFISGVAHQLVTPREILPQQDLAFGLVSVALIFVWYRIDAQERGFRRSAVLNTMVVALTVVALPYYLFRSRGLSKGAVATGLLIAWAITYTAFQYVGVYMAYFLSRRL
ncbi:MAG: hypothetical protein ACJ8R9_13220 [Steroidobacteraceae bacterium]